MRGDSTDCIFNVWKDTSQALEILLSGKYPSPAAVLRCKDS